MPFKSRKMAFRKGLITYAKIAYAREGHTRVESTQSVQGRRKGIVYPRAEEKERWREPRERTRGPKRRTGHSRIKPIQKKIE